MESNPYNLKVLDEKPSDYLSGEELVDFLAKHKIPIKRMDNLPRFAYSNNIDMKKITRVGSFGSTPTIFKTPNSSQIKKILESMKNNNNSVLGKELLKKKKEKILEIFDKAEDHKETRTSIAEKVAKSLGVNCNRKLVRAVLDAKRSSKLEKLKKIS
jgi:arsenate reductase-like glutaredoxin family protein